MDSYSGSTDINICLEILRAWKQLKSVIESFAAEHDLTLPQVVVLYQLHTEDQVLMGTLAKHMHCDASNITGMADRLQTLQLISRREMPEDRRAKLLSITAEGKGLINELLPRLPTGLGFGRLSTAELSELHRLLIKLGTC